ncbi:MAG TPA: AAA family ATPase [Anaerolineae bacterium]|nr:AAA family ATPase [Anaerolineae bacterium]
MKTTAIPPTLIILSGLPGCGKSTMAAHLSSHLHCPVLAIDDVTSALPSHLTQHSPNYWEDMVGILLHLADSYLDWFPFLIIDSVFMGVDPNHTIHSWSDRLRAQQIAHKHNINYRPIYLYLSDEQIWRQRLTTRAAQYNNPEIATWSQVSHQRHLFQPWQPDQALFIDSLNPLTTNLHTILAYLQS